MLGAGKKMPDMSLLPQDIQAMATYIQQQPIDREEQFLQIASLAFNYRQSGVAALQKPDAIIAKAAHEEKQYCSAAAMQALNETLDTESLSLLYIWLTLCNKNQRIVTPATIPTMLALAVQNKKLRTDILTACGKRGQWLCQFNKEWNFTIAETPEEIWQTGALEQRKQVLLQLRKTDALAALQWLTKTWPQEDANTKTELLPVLETNIGEGDNLFLESLSNENSKKVKALALSLLKKIPTSNIVQQYCAIVKQAVYPKKEKGLFGLSSKVVLNIQLPQVDESIYASGVEKLSSNKEMPDELFIIYQLMQHVPLALYEDWWQMKPQEIIDLFQKDTIGIKLVPALVMACTRYKDARWAVFLMQYSTTFYLDILPLLPLQQQEFYSSKFFATNPDSIIKYALHREDEWGIELTANIFTHAAKNPYQYNRTFFSQYIHLIPGAILQQMEKFVPAEEYMRSTWGNTSTYIAKLLQVKANIIQSFKQ